MAQHTFSPIIGSQLRPKTWFAQAMQQQGFIHDSAQAAAIDRLDDLWQRLVDFRVRRHGFLGHSLRNPAVPRGIYLWGSVGRGKSLLMDAFYECVPYQRKRRVHFHHFMAEIHRQLQSLPHETDPLLLVADRIARLTRLLCFDEFHVSDIADAMILGRLLQALFARGVVLVTTSNYPPSGLYPNGLQRERFLPAIALLEQHLDSIAVDGGTDYRLRELSQTGLFRVPASPDNEAAMRATFDSMCKQKAEEAASPLQVLGREIPVKRRAPGMVWFDFADLCDGPRSQNDYLEIARDYHTVFLSGIPALADKDASAARRFTWLIDVFYDHRVKLVASSAVPPEQIYLDGQQASEFFRTVSRLNEMQTESYLALPHQVDAFQLDPSRSVAL